MSFARAQAEYDAQEPEDGSQARCNRCGDVAEEHVHQHTFRMKGDVFTATSDYGFCPESIEDIEGLLFESQFEERDLDQEREEAAIGRAEARMEDR